MELVRTSGRSLVLTAALAAFGCGEGPPPAARPTLAAAPTEPAAIPAPPAIVPPVAELPPTQDVAGPVLLSEKWYTMLDDGQQSGWLHVTWRRSTYKGQPTIHDRTVRYARQTRQMGSVEDVFETTSTSDLERTDEGLLLRQDTFVQEPGRTTVVMQRWTGSGYERSATVGDVAQRWELACETPVPVDAEAFLARRVQSGGVDVGDSFAFPSPNFEGRRLDTVRLAVVGRAMLSLPTGTADCLHVEETVDGVPGKTELWLDPEGIVRQYVVASMRLMHTTEQRARDVPVHGVSYSITTEAHPYLPRATSIDEAVVRVTIPVRDGLDVPRLEDTPFSTELDRDGDTIRVRLTSHERPDATVALPVTDENLAHWLRPTLLECSDHASVQAALRAAVGDEKDGRTVATELLRYVFVTLEKGSGPTASPNAAEILRDGLGDCSEHAVLFVALCRAAGLPARRLSGYAQVGEHWGSHAFCEVWLGEWVGADPTTNELGTKARYIAFGWADDPDSFPGVWAQRLRGGASITTVSFREGDDEYDVAGLARGPLDDPFSGVRFDAPPDGWRVRFLDTPGAARLSGPSVTGRVRVHAGMGWTPADMMATHFFGRPEALGTFAGRPAVVIRRQRGELTKVSISVPHRRRLFIVDLDVEDGADVDAAVRAVEDLIAPTFAD